MDSRPSLTPGPAAESRRFRPFIRLASGRYLVTPIDPQGSISPSSATSQDSQNGETLDLGTPDLAALPSSV